MSEKQCLSRKLKFFATVITIPVMLFSRLCFKKMWAYIIQLNLIIFPNQSVDIIYVLLMPPSSNFSHQLTFVKSDVWVHQGLKQLQDVGKIYLRIKKLPTAQEGSFPKNIFYQSWLNFVKKNYATITLEYHAWQLINCQNQFFYRCMS